jgi:glycosyltransferase involved in cell wall biosynthesis
VSGALPDLTFSIVIETDNLEIADLDALRDCLRSLGDQQPALARAKGVFLVDGGELPDQAFAEFRRDHPWLTILRVEPGTAYIGLKAHGAALSDSDVIIFCDSDVRYEPGWLAGLLSGFRERPEAHIVGGETTTPIRGPYSLAFALTFNFPRFSGDTALVPSPMYWANNVAIRRPLIEQAPIPDPAVLYRGQNLVHGQELVRRGVTIWRQPRARAVHIVVPPAEIVRRYVILGRDSASLARLTRDGSGRPSLVAMPPDRSDGSQIARLAGRIRQVVRANPRHAALLPLAAPIVAFLVACYFAGKLPPATTPRGSHGA